MESAKVLGRIQDGLERILGQRRDEQGRIMERSKFIEDLQQMALAEGLAPVDEAKRGGLEDITSEARAALIYQQQTGQAYGFAGWKAGQDADALEAAPAQRLVRIRQARQPRDWRARWQAAGDRVGWQGALREQYVALKSSRIWGALSRFDVPWPPFDFGSGMWVEEVPRAEAERLGLVGATADGKGKRVTADNADGADGGKGGGVTEELARGVTGVGPELRQTLQGLFGPQVEIDGDVIRWKGDARAYEQVAAANRQDSGRIFSRGAEALGGDRLGGGSPARDRGIPAAEARGNAVEISAVATGRKPLFHEDWGLEPEHAARVARELQGELPQGVVARSEGSHLFVYHQGLLSKFADPERPLWPQVVAHADEGRWLGYGLNRAAGEAGVRVRIEDAAGHAVAGFTAPEDTAELYAAARALDWTRATGQVYHGIILRGGAR